MEPSNFGCQPATETELIDHVTILELVRTTNHGGQLGSVACIVEYFVKSDYELQARDRIRDRFRHNAASSGASQFTGIPVHHHPSEAGPCAPCFATGLAC